MKTESTFPSFLKKTTALRRTGFSLQEMLIVIAIIGLVSLIGLPIITSFKAQAQEAVAKRNAQLLSQTAAAAGAIGNTRISSARSKPEAIALVVEGVTSGPFNDSIGVGGLSAADQQAASRYLGFRNGMLSYISGGISSLTAAEQGDDDDEDYESEAGDGRWFAQLLAGASSGVTDPAFLNAGSTASAISLLVNGLGGGSVAGLSSAEQQAAASYLSFQNGVLSFNP